MTNAEKIEKVLSKVEKTLLPNGKWHVKESLNLANNNLTSLEDLNVEIVDGDLECYYNSLTSLEGAPKEVRGNFYCYTNSLTSLIGAPRKVGGGFYCYSNRLTTLEGAPKEVGGGFYCYTNSLTSLDGAPREVGGIFICDAKFNKTEEYKELIKTYETIKALNTL